MLYMNRIIRFFLFCSFTVLRQFPEQIKTAGQVPLRSSIAIRTVTDQTYIIGTVYCTSRMDYNRVKQGLQQLRTSSSH